MNAGRAFAVLFLAVLAAPIARSQPAPPTPDAKKAPEASKGGLVVFIDPVTGKIRQPDPAEIGALVAPPAAPAAPRAETPLVMKTGPGGAVGVVLDERFESFMVVTKTPDGKLAMSCVEGKQKADAAVAAKGKADAR